MAQRGCPTNIKRLFLLPVALFLFCGYSEGTLVPAGVAVRPGGSATPTVTPTATPPPIVVTKDGTQVGATSFKANLSVNPNGSACTVYFEYGTTTNYGSATASYGAGAGQANVDRGIVITGLATGTLYHFRASATNAATTVKGSDKTITTSTPTPTPTPPPNGVIDTPAGNVGIVAGGSVSFTGTGTESFGNTPITYLWNFGSGSGITNSTAEDPGSKTFSTSGTFTTTFTVTNSAGIADPTPDTRVVTVAPSASPTPTPDPTPTPTPTPTATPVPTVVTGSASSIGLNRFTANGTINPNGSAATYKFDCGTSISYGSSTAVVQAGSGSTAVAEAAVVSGLSQGTLYHFRISGTNPGGTAVGLDATVTTSTPTPTPTPTPTATPILALSFNNITGSAVADDSHSGNTYTITGVQGDPGTSFTPGTTTSFANSGSAWNAAGASQQRIEASGTALTVTAFTIMADVKISGTDTDPVHNRWEVSEKAGSYWANIREDQGAGPTPTPGPPYKLRVGGFFDGVGDESFVGNTGITPGVWTNVAFRFDPTAHTMATFINGVPDKSQSRTGTLTDSTTQNGQDEKLVVGAKHREAGTPVIQAFFDGQMDNYRLYNVALSDAQIAVLAGVPVPAPQSPPTGVFYMPSNGTIGDLTVLNNSNVDGVVVGSEWSVLEPSEGSYSYTFLDTAVTAVEAATGGGKVMRLTINTGGPGASAGGSKPNWLITKITNDAYTGTKFFSYKDGSTCGTGSTVTIPVFWEPTLLTRHALLAQAVATHLASHPLVKIVYVPFANSNTNDYDLGDITTCTDGLGGTPKSRWLAMFPTPAFAPTGQPAYSTMATALIGAGNATFAAYRTAFLTKYLTTSIGRLNDPDLNPTGAGANKGRNVFEDVLNTANIAAPGLVVAQKNNLNGGSVPHAPASSNNAWSDLWRLHTTFGLPVAAQMVWHAYDDCTGSLGTYGATRMNGGTGTPCIDSTLALKQAVETGVTYETKWQEIYEPDVKNLNGGNADPDPAASDVIAYAHTQLYHP